MNLSLIKEVFKDVLEEEEKIKAEHPEEWEKCKKDYQEFWDVMMPIIEKDPSFISRRYYGKRKAEAAEHGEIHSDTEDH